MAPETDLLPTLTQALRALGPLDAATIQRLWWPDAALLTVQRRLRAFVQTGALAASVQAERRTGVTRRTGTRYHLPRQTWQLPDGAVAQQTHVDVLALLAALHGIPGLVGVHTWTLRPNGGGRVVQMHHDVQAGPHPLGLPWCALPPAGCRTRTLLLIADQPTIGLGVHHAAAQMLARRCGPAWEQRTPPPRPIVVVATRERLRPVLAAWQAGWSGSAPRIALRAAVQAQGWLAPIWWTGQQRLVRQPLLVGWCPRDDTLWDAQDYWTPESNARPSSRAPPACPAR